MALQYPKIYLYRRIVDPKLFIDQNYADNIDLNNIADEVYFSKYHFCRQFRKIYGKTPHQYLIRVRINTDANGKYFIEPISDPEHVDEKRKEIGLGPLADYLKQWDIVWPTQK
ncbi:MAG TPA: AraC family transcriptional regulator [Flavobacteriales bacterium]|nr:AraC family transcriptional regulator [Flavobacteriales bacterium]